jgi:low affinity Fe/Cu permease
MHAKEHAHGNTHRVAGFFHRFAHRIADGVGSAGAFVAAVILVAAWAVTGPIFAYSDTWQLTINTGTTIVTFLMVFLIQNTQSRDANAIQLKLDELIHGVKGARNTLIDLEELSDEELDELHQEFHRIHEHCLRKEEAGRAGQSTPRRRQSVTAESAE